MNITQYINESQMPIVLWESRKGIILSNGKRQSPAVRLEHEFDHAIDDWKSAKNHREKRMTCKRVRDAAFFFIIMLVTFAATLLKPQKYVSSRTIQKCVEHVSTST